MKIKPNTAELTGYSDTGLRGKLGAISTHIRKTSNPYPELRRGKEVTKIRAEIRHFSEVARHQINVENSFYLHIPATNDWSLR